MKLRVTAKYPIDIPEGYEEKETYERVGRLGFRFFRCRAVRLAQKYPPLVGSYRYELTRVAPFFYEIVCYQNILVPKNKPKSGDSNGGQ